MPVQPAEAQEQLMPGRDKRRRGSERTEPGSVRRPTDSSEPLPPSLQPPAGGRGERRRGRPGQVGPAENPPEEPRICQNCKKDRHLHDFTFKSKWACQCRHPGHGLPKGRRA